MTMVVPRPGRLSRLYGSAWGTRQCWAGLIVHAHVLPGAKLKQGGQGTASRIQGRQEINGGTRWNFPGAESGPVGMSALIGEVWIREDGSRWSYRPWRR